jgi:mono/diheme cytochrome c family protein
MEPAPRHRIERQRAETTTGTKYESFSVKRSRLCRRDDGWDRSIPSILYCGCGNRSPDDRTRGLSRDGRGLHVLSYGHRRKSVGRRSLYAPPFGEISTPNITPDRVTGIGEWTDDEFYRAMHEGIGRQNEYLYPVFPFPWFTKITRDDALAIKAYLFSLAPENAPRKPLKLGFPFNIREGLGAWRAAFFKAETFTPDPNRSAEINRGAYLVEGPGHCGECHNHHNIFGASNWSGKLEGGEIEGWYAPNITSDGHEGIGSWSIDQIATFLKSGSTPTAGVALGPMKETIDASLQHLSDQDLHAIAAYLKSVTGHETYKPAGPQAARSDSAQAYLSYCASCHQLDGRGVSGIIPALAGNGAVKAQGPENVVRVVLGGMEAAHGLAPMPAVGASMSDQEIADVVNYIRAVTNVFELGPGHAR